MPPDSLTPIIADAVAAFRADMAHKAAVYGLDAPCALLRDTTGFTQLPEWETWLTWSARHMVALRALLQREQYHPSPETQHALRQRLHDLFGHIIVGLSLCCDPPVDAPLPIPPADDVDSSATA